MSSRSVVVSCRRCCSSSAAEITPIRELDGRVIGAGKRGPITTKIQKLFFDVVNGKVPKYKHWLTQVGKAKPAKKSAKKAGGRK